MFRIIDPWASETYTNIDCATFVRLSCEHDVDVERLTLACRTAVTGQPAEDPLFVSPVSAACGVFVGLDLGHPVALRSRVRLDGAHHAALRRVAATVHKLVISPLPCPIERRIPLLNQRNHCQSHLGDLNPRPAVYETAALPLS